MVRWHRVILFPQLTRSQGGTGASVVLTTTPSAQLSSLDSLGHHRAFWSVGERGFALESAVAEICANLMDNRRLRGVADGLLSLAKLAVEVSLLSGQTAARLAHFHSGWNWRRTDSKGVHSHPTFSACCSLPLLVTEAESEGCHTCLDVSGYH